MPVQVDFTHFHRYDELEQVLREFQAAYPQLCQLHSVGKSYEGRDLWLVEITNPATGPGPAKPGYYIDANIHSWEVTGSATALYTIHYLLSRYGQDEEVTRLVDGLVFYILPRVSPDGVEAFLTRGVVTRSSVRWYPFAEEQDGLLPEDINADGRILQIRITDPHGEWKTSDQDPRLLVPRKPDDYGGTYYRVWPEGRIRGYDGVEIKLAPIRWGLDLNRNFPAGWEPEAKQLGAGPFPLSEPETRAVAEFITAHPNICGLQNYHTTTGIILRPSAQRSDDQINRKDLAALKAIGELGEEVTGYPCVSIFDDFAYQKGKPLIGGMIDWAYDNLGILTFSTELWDLRVRAGCERVPFTAKKYYVEEDGLRILRWLDQNLGGRGFFDWQPFDHPQLGPVEIGGWDTAYVLANCPPEFLVAEAHKNCRFTLRHAAASPRLALDRAAAEHLGDGVFRVEAVVRNHGYLPTSGTERAKEVRAVQPDYVELSLPDGAELVLGKAREEVGHLDGRVWAPAGVFYPLYHSWVREKRLEWVIKAPPGTSLTVTACSQRGGTARAAVALA